MTNIILVIYIYVIDDTNKSHFVIQVLCCETVCTSCLENCIVDFLRTDHIKTETNQIFTNIATLLTKQNYFNHLYVHTNIYAYICLLLILHFSMLLL